mmetsp:Transcript_30280/g.97449  ORF Transcript_30280/g.97449 Transcript_30280/m.97449 type:complete len:132 (-) Transcript_30280:2144-2539(-)
MAAENERRELEAKLKSQVWPRRSVAVPQAGVQAEKEEEEWNKSVLSGVKSAAGVKYQDEALSLSESIHQLVSSTSFSTGWRWRLRPLTCCRFNGGIASYAGDDAQGDLCVLGQANQRLLRCCAFSARPIVS